MGKRLDQLNLGDSGPTRRDDLAISRRDGARLLAQVLEMLEGGEYDFAWGFLKDLSLTLEKTEVATEAQTQAVQNIVDGKVRHDRAAEGWERHERRTGRRYEGWTRGDR